MKYVALYTVFLMLFFIGSTEALGQPGTTIDIKKPEKYENRTLTSEKSGDKKFSFPKKLTQNAFTHYNYYFNANNILNNIVAEAKKNFIDDYTRLLPFYNYTLEETSTNSEIDSVIYKTNAGILLHDLRSDWVDNMYLLMGKAYFYRKDFDSASQVFRYINYAFAPKEEGGYDIPIGSSAANTNGTFSIATKEKNSLPQKIFATPPSRNDALLWQAKNYIATDHMGEAAGIIEILKNDPVFPARLKAELNETQAYWFYKTNLYDSAANHIISSLDNATSKQERARMEFLAAQLFQLTGNNDQAVFWYNKSASHTTDPILEVNANLNSIKAFKDSSTNLLKEKLDNLYKMAHRDKYLSNRDIIYYAVAQVELETKNNAGAVAALKKSILNFNEDNPEQRSLSFMLLADINYDSQDYTNAKNNYDSVSLADLKDEKDKARFSQRQEALTIIAANLQTLHEQDSLQHTALLPKDQRDALIKKTVRYLRKQQGLKEEPDVPFVNPAIQQQTQVNIFNTATGADWYFNNQSLKGTGYSEFKQKWGNRPNTDNWRRQAAVDAQNTANDSQDANDNGDDQTVAAGGKPAPNTGENGEISFESLLANLPVTEEQLNASNDKIIEALFTNGQAFQNKLEDYPSAITAYETLMQTFPANGNAEQALFSLYYCYNKMGRTKSADSVLALLNSKYAKGQYTAKINNPKAVVTVKENVNDPATKAYNQIYNLFLEGNFEAAIQAKTNADSAYGKSYWSPQLLYIEAIYYVSKKEDSTAIEVLNNLSELYGDSPLAEKASTMIDVLNRRQEIEDYLTNLQITRNDKETSLPVVDLTAVNTTIEKTEIKRETTVSKPITQLANTKVDTTSKVTNVSRYLFNANDPQYVVILLNKVAPVYINEAKNAFTRYNQTTAAGQKLEISPLKLDDNYNLVLIGPFTDAALAIDYVDKTKPITSSRILPWLTADKYSYTILSNSNLAILKDTKDLEGYKALLNQVLPGKF
jgi:outer membrane protein assembly factor BamD (BamD/ComL family)